MPSRHCSRALLVCALLGLQSGVTAQQPTSDGPNGVESTFLIYFRAIQIGREDYSVTRTDEGWTIASSAAVGSPVNLMARRVQLRYTRDWKPMDLAVDATLSGQPMMGRITVSGDEAVSVFNEAGQSGERRDAIPADAILLPNA